MGGRKTNESDTTVLKRIAATLIALAVLCELASRYPRPVRQLVLWIMRPTEAVIREFLIGWAADLGIGVETPENYFFHQDDDCSGAIHMALKFRALSQLLKDLLRYQAATRSLDCPGANGVARMLCASRLARMAANLTALHGQLCAMQRRGLPVPDT